MVGYQLVVGTELGFGRAAWGFVLSHSGEREREPVSVRFGSFGGWRW